MARIIKSAKGEEGRARVAQRVEDAEQRASEVVREAGELGLAHEAHPTLLHHAPRGAVARQGPGRDGFEVERLKTHAQGARGDLGRVAHPPHASAAMW